MTENEGQSKLTTESFRKIKEFLKNLYPYGPYFISGIHPFGKGIRNTSFLPHKPDYESKLKTWLEKHQGIFNCYFGVNNAESDFNNSKNQRPAEKDICTIDYFQVDIDPDKTKPFEEEFSRIKLLVNSPMPEGVPKPTFCIFSGGGFQLFWKLKDRIVVRDPRQISQAKLYNKKLCDILGGDTAAVDVARIMRLPFTLNIPNKDKEKAGRVPTVAAIEYENWDLEYTLDQFTPSDEAIEEKVKQRGNLPESNVTIHFNKEIERVDDLEKFLPDEKHDRIRIIINKGKIPKDHQSYREKKDDSKSAWLHDCICNLCRAGKNDDEIYTVITDIGFGISKALFKEEIKDPHREAVRQIQRGRQVVANDDPNQVYDEGLDPKLEKLNKQHAFIKSFGKIMFEYYEESTGKFEVEFLHKDAFTTYYSNQKVQDGIKPVGSGSDIKFIPNMKPLGKTWLSHPSRRSFEKVNYYPNHHNPRTYNLWRGFAYTPKVGDWSLLQNHMMEVMCRNNLVDFEYLYKWLARAFQRPEDPGEVMLIMQGEKGGGKSMFADHVGAIFGPHYVCIADSDKATGKFNRILMGKSLGLLDEAFFAKDRRADSKLKNLITDKHIQIEPKGVDSFDVRNCLTLMAASNEEHVVRASKIERRYFALKLSDEHIGDFAYFERIREQMENGGYEAMLHDMLNFDISDFNHRLVPVTEELRAQKVETREFHENWLSECLQAAYFSKEYHGYITNKHVYESYIEFIKVHKFATPLTPEKLGRYLGKVLPSLGRSITRSWKDLPEGYKQVRKLPEINKVIDEENPEKYGHWAHILREEFDKFYDVTTDWDEISTENQMEMAYGVHDPRLPRDEEL